MPEATTEPRPACPTCGTLLPSDAPTVGGRPACPRCLLAAGVPTGGRTADAPSAAEVAAAFPDHEILGLLGRGGMGVVWKARQKGLDRLVALKVLPREVAAVPGFAERFQREARALARVTHPNIVGVHEYGERAGIYFLVLEYVDGTNVREAMREGRVAPAAALRIVPQICDALQYAHEHGVVHRDIKPENVLLDGEGRVKVTDFGLAKIVGADGADGRADLTVTGQVMGTPHYMAPEQFERPATVDHRADIFSLGVVFYEMLTGELPLGRFDPPSKRVQVDVRLDEVVLRSLEKAPERRWQHAVDVKSEVGTIEATPWAAAPVPAPPGVRRTSWLAVVALGLAVTAIVPAIDLVAGRVGHGARTPMALALVALAIAATTCGIVSWVRIARSSGALRGLPFAVTAAALPVFFGVLVLPVALYFVRRSAAVADQAERMDRVRSLVEGRLAIRPGEKALDRLRAALAQPIPNLVSLYSAADLEGPLRFMPGLKLTDEDGRPRTDLGLPWMVLGWDAQRLQWLTATTEMTVGDRDHWRITAVDGVADLTYTFDIVLEEGVPRFRATPVIVTNKYAGAPR